MMEISELDKQSREYGWHNTIDPSIGGIVDECARKFYYRYIRGITPLKEPDYFVSGRAWDAARGAWEANIEDPKVAFQAATDAINRVYDTCNCDFFKDNRTRENLIALLTRFVLSHGDPPYKTIGSNIGFKFPYKDFYLGGELDQYMDWPPYGVVVGEEKTTTVIPGSKGWPSYENQFTLGRYSNQQVHYQWATLQVSENLWGTRILVACLDIPKRASTERTLFQPIWKQVVRQEMLDYLTLCEERHEKILRCWDKWRWPKEGQHCTGPWGSFPCEYQLLCKLPVALHQLEIPSNLFKVGEPWAPWDGIKGKEVGEGA